MIRNGMSGPSSLVYIQAKESYPKKEFVFDDLSLSIPFPELSGENVEFLGKCSDATFAISNFRFFAVFEHYFINIPLMLIENLDWRGKDIPEILISCKNGQSFQLKVDSAEECNKWFERLKKKCVMPERPEHFFAFAYYAWCQDDSLSADVSDLNCYQARDASPDLHCDFLNEYKRMGFDKDPAWKITDINSKYKLCSSYPKLHIVPSHITDEKLENVANFRASKRFPSAVWRHRENGAVIVRCSQPGVGFWYSRCEDDEYYLQTLGDVIDSAKPVLNGKNESLNGESDSSADVSSVELSRINGFSEKTNSNEKTICNGIKKKVLVVDCRSYIVTFGNRVKGGGSECIEYYPNCKILYMNLANIHSIRQSFQSLRELCCKEDEQTDWLASLEATKWLSNISSLIKTALVVVKAIEQEKQHVVVHCSDGWDRTPQVVALAELLLDPFYRTIKGFRVLFEREWLAFGHKFADRCGHTCQDYDVNKRCPVFLQFLDCVHQLLRQFPCSFEFNETFLVKLAHHTYSCLYGTFLFNTEQERLAANITHRTCSVWSMLECQSRSCRNFLYSPSEAKVLYPEYQVRNILLWSSLYLSTPLIFFGNSSSLNLNDTALNTEEAFPNDCSRTELEIRPNLVRRNSDGDVKVSCNDENFVGCSGARDDSDLYLTKSLVCKSDTNLSPSKSLLVNGLDRKSHEDINDICENNTLDRNRTLECNNKMENGYENNSIDQNGILGEHDGDLNCENTVVDQNGIPAKDGGVDGCENTVVDQSGAEKSSDLSESMTSSSNTIIEDCNCSNTDEASSSEIHNGKMVSESGLEISQTRSASKAINCRSNHRLDNITVETKLQQDGLAENYIENHTSKVGFREFEESPKSPKDNKLGKYLDVDGLSLVVDPVQARLVKLEGCYLEEIEGLVEQLQAKGCVCGIRQKVNMKNHMVSNLEPTFEGSSSLSSNAASDTYGSWERVDGDDVTPVMWLPDHHAISCGGCDSKFSVMIRKHHCRNCGKVFCGSCCNDMTPVPSEQYYDPVRVCKMCFESLHVKNGQDITAAAS